MTMAELEIVFQPFDDVAGFNAGGELAVLCESLFPGEGAEVSGTLAGLCVNVGEVGLEGHF